MIKKIKKGDCRRWSKYQGCPYVLWRVEVPLIEGVEKRHLQGGTWSPCATPESGHESKTGHSSLPKIRFRFFGFLLGFLDPIRIFSILTWFLAIFYGFLILNHSKRISRFNFLIKITKFSKTCILNFGPFVLILIKFKLMLAKIQEIVLGILLPISILIFSLNQF